MNQREKVQHKSLLEKYHDLLMYANELQNQYIELQNAHMQLQKTLIHILEHKKDSALIALLAAHKKPCTQ